MKEIRTADCPDWCCLAHSNNAPIAHEAPSIAVPVGLGDDRAEFFEIRAVQYLTEDSGTTYDSAPAPFVEFAHHVNGRYSLVNMSTAQVRELVDAMLRSADAADSAAGRHCHQHSGT
jgi:hypothetical protein